MNSQFQVDLLDLRWLTLAFVLLLFFMYQWSRYKSIESNLGGAAKQPGKVYFRRALGMMGLSNHKADLYPIHLHLADPDKRTVGRRKTSRRA